MAEQVGMRLCYVKWLDHFSIDGWTSHSRVAHDPVVIETVGWELPEQEDERILLLCTSKSNNGRAAYHMGILHIAILEHWYIECPGV